MTYAVHSVGEAGVVREECTGLATGHEAIREAERLQALTTRPELFFPINEDDPEENVYRAWEDRYPDEKEPV